MPFSSGDDICTLYVEFNNFCMFMSKHINNEFLKLYYIVWLRLSLFFDKYPLPNIQIIHCHTTFCMLFTG